MLGVHPVEALARLAGDDALFCTLGQLSSGFFHRAGNTVDTGHVDGTVGHAVGDQVALITDGRFSGATRGASIGHVSPEAASGGPIGLVEEGDLIAIDIPAHSITLKVSDEELEVRRAKWVCPEPKIRTGYLARYAKMVSSADRGAILV